MTASASGQRHRHGAVAVVAATRLGELVPKHLAMACLHQHQVLLMIHGALRTLLVLRMRRRRELVLARLHQRPSMRQHLVPTTLPHPVRSTLLPLVAGRVDGVLIVRQRLVLLLRLRPAQVEATTVLPRPVAMVLLRRLPPAARDTQMMTREWCGGFEQWIAGAFRRFDPWAFWFVA